MTKDTEKKQKEFFNCLVCPISRTKLIFNEKTQELISKASGVGFPVRNGVPILLVDEARKLD